MFRLERDILSLRNSVQCKKVHIRPERDIFDYDLYKNANCVVSLGHVFWAVVFVPTVDRSEKFFLDLGREKASQIALANLVPLDRHLYTLLSR